MLYVLFLEDLKLMGVTEFAQPYVHMDVWSILCPTLYLFQVYLLEGNLSRRYASSRSYHQRCTSENCFSFHPSHSLPFSNELKIQCCSYNSNLMELSYLY